jgi:hypothetical protein
MLQPTLPFLRPKFSSNFKKKERKKGRKKERFVRSTDRPTDGRTDGPTDAHGLLYAVPLRRHAVMQAAISMSPPSLPSRIIAGRRCCDNTHPYVRSNMLPSVGGPGADRRSRSRYLTPLEQQIYYWMYGHHQTVVRFFLTLRKVSK